MCHVWPENYLFICGRNVSFTSSPELFLCMLHYVFSVKHYAPNPFHFAAHYTIDRTGTVKQAENGLQSQSSENGSVALWIEIAVILNWR